MSIMKKSNCKGSILKHSPVVEINSIFETISMGFCIKAVGENESL